MTESHNPIERGRQIEWFEEPSNGGVRPEAQEEALPQGYRKDVRFRCMLNKLKGSPETSVEGETGPMVVKPIAAERGLLSRFIRFDQNRPGANGDQGDARDPDLSKIDARNWAQYGMVKVLTNAKANGSGGAAVASGERG
ncbi:hypothetical protein DFH06DRAFT_1139350 [Mycena polygramma]|nr:hypothetical protein DFH06DRAFT_1139350 [Mycena polygramma]